MFLRKFIFIFFIALFSTHASAQKDSTHVKQRVKIKKQQKFKGGTYNPLAPSKAAFYSAIFPGMGQVYNKKYWKAPIVWGALGTSLYYYRINADEYTRYRTAFKLREAGLKDEFTLDDGAELISRNGLVSAQKVLRKNRDMSLFTTLLFYVLQVVEASVNAHLLQFNTSDELSFEPLLLPDPIEIDMPIVGLSLTYTF